MADQNMPAAGPGGGRRRAWSRRRTPIQWRATNMTAMPPMTGRMPASDSQPKVSVPSAMPITAAGSRKASFAPSWRER